MDSKKRNTSIAANILSTVFRDFVLESPETELDDALREQGENPESFLSRGKNAIQKAFEQQKGRHPADSVGTVSEDQILLHEGLGSLLQLLRRRAGLSQKELATNARIEAEEIRRIEEDTSYTPSPRTVYQLEEYFSLPERTLILLSGTVSTQPRELRDEILRFAANSKTIGKLSRQEKKLVNEFVRFLAKQAKKGG